MKCSQSSCASSYFIFMVRVNFIIQTLCTTCCESSGTLDINELTLPRRTQFRELKF